MSFWHVVAVGAAALALGFVIAKVLKITLRRARDDHAKRPALWNRFYSIDWGDTTTNNYGYAPAEGDHPQRFQHQMYLQLLHRLREAREVKTGLKLLEVSCGRGGGLNALLSKAPEIDATGLDVAHSAVDFCRRTYGENDRLRFVQGSALDLPFPDATFDLVLQYTVFSSILDQGLRRNVATELGRVLRPRGSVLWYDIRVDNPRNPDIRRVTRSELDGLFPGWRVDARSITLAPPLARRLARVNWLAAAIGATLPFLRSHLLARIRKPE